MIQLPQTVLQIMTRNPHTSISALIYIAAKFGGPIAIAWMPARTAEITKTVDALEGLAVFYGFTMAGDARPRPPKEGEPIQPENTAPPASPKLPLWFFLAALACAASLIFGRRAFDKPQVSNYTHSHEEVTRAPAGSLDPHRLLELHD